MSRIILYDLVPTVTSDSPVGPSFSPFCMRARLALLRKNVQFETRFVTYHDLRFGDWKEKLGVSGLVTGGPILSAVSAPPSIPTRHSKTPFVQIW